MLRSLLLTRDENAVKVIGRIFKDLEVACEHAADHTSALHCMAKHRFDAVVIDDSIEEASAILQKLIETPSYSKSVRILLADATSNAGAGFKAHIQVVLYKPLSAERVRHGLRAVRNLMARDRRRGTKRVPTMLSARIRHGRAAGGKVFISDLSESGAAVQCTEGHVPTGNVHLDFVLPEELDHIHVTVEVVWQDNQGGAGVRFLDMASSARKRLADWLKQEAARVATQGHKTLAKSIGL